MLNLSKNLSAVIQVGFCYIIIASAQALWKLGVIKLTGTAKFTFSALPRYISSWYFLLGAGLYVIATGVWIYILSKYEFNLVYPMNALGYIFAVFLSLWLFGESIPWNRYVGIAVIIIGVIIIALK
jgi:drug/metabolite transporter (DMT)-like permease